MDLLDTEASSMGAVPHQPYHWSETWGWVTKDGVDKCAEVAQGVADTFKKVTKEGG